MSETPISFKEMKIHPKVSNSTSEQQNTAFYQQVY